MPADRSPEPTAPEPTAPEDDPRLRYQVRDITVRRTEGMELVFEDDVTARFSLLELRQACPCAACRGLRDQKRPAWTGDPARLEIRDAELVGAWGVRIVWNDGHGTGIYPWEHLRRWADVGVPQWGRDSGLGA